jgi:hypothetical protein
VQILATPYIPEWPLKLYANSPLANNALISFLAANGYPLGGTAYIGPNCEEEYMVVDTQRVLPSTCTIPEGQDDING